MQRERSYWRGVKARLLPAFAAGLVAGLVLCWLNDAEVGILSGLAAFACAALIPPRSSRRDHT
jgi:hypothetical protein